MTKASYENSERTKSAAKSAAIIEGAMKEFLRHGYAATSMDKVAKSAKVSKATVYSHFGDKESLFNAVIQDLVKDEFQQVMELEAPDSLEQDPQIVLSAIANRMLNKARSDRSFQDFMRITIGESGRFPEIAQAYVNNVAKPAIDLLTKYLQSHPKLKLEDPEATVRVMLGTMVYFVMLQEMMHGKDIVPLESDRVIQTLTNMITNQSQN